MDGLFNKMRPKSYFFIGIGGIGMGALAALLLDKNFFVSGADLYENQVTHQLRQRGAKIHIGHRRENLVAADFVVISSAIPTDNPELQVARELGIPILLRARLLAQLMEGHEAITIAGAHGKTTTSSMIAHMLKEADFKPTTSVGGIVIGGSHAGIGEGKYFVAEVDESDGTFLYFHPTYSVITNMDREHLDHYKDWSSIIKAYEQFIDNTKPQGVLIICGEDQKLKESVQASGKTYKTYGFSKENDMVACDVVSSQFEQSFDCFYEGEKVGRFTLNIPGRHNILNAMACILMGKLLFIDPEVISKALVRFQGVRRRFEQKAYFNQIRVIDDYAHHPTEIRAVIQTARAMTKGKLYVLFQPHRYSRTKFLFDDFSQCFGGSDLVIVLDVYAASEKPIEGVSSESLASAIKEKSSIDAMYLKKEEAIPHLLNAARPGDMILALGAGDITQVSTEIAKELQASVQEDSKDKAKWIA